MTRLAYFARETFISLRRNLLMTAAGIITVAISLFLFGGILLVSATVDHGTERWKDGVELIIFMNTKAGQPQIDGIREALEADPEVRSFTFLDHEATYEDFKKLLDDQPALVESIRPEDLPVSFRVVPTEAEFTKLIADNYRNRPGVDAKDGVITAQEQVDRLLTATRWIRIAFFAMAFALLASSTFMIVNTIRLATYARRREIEVMKLVGASNWFVRVPFMAEGLVQGAIGAGFAVGMIWILKIIIANLLDRPATLLSTFRVTNGDAMGIGLLVLFIGAMIGMIGSAIGLRRFLEV